jgi:hypothetical protein
MRVLLQSTDFLFSFLFFLPVEESGDHSMPGIAAPQRVPNANRPD